MFTILLLVIIYLAFISLGLPDALLGVAWPAMQTDLGLPLDAAGLIALITTCCMIASSFLSGYIIKKFGTSKVTLLSCLATGLALLGFSFSPSFVWLLLLSVPLGFGAGSVDAALNNYVALHFKAHHMNWLHAFWGVGATLGPVIMASALLSPLSWRGGYRTIAFFQLGLSVVFLATLPLWSRHKAISAAKDSTQTKVPLFKTKGLPYALLTFFFYTSVEISVGLWGSSYMVASKALGIDVAAYWVALYYGSITAGRVLSGFISIKIKNTTMIRVGAVIALFATVLLLLPLHHYITLAALIMLGFGLSPIFPAMLHETPIRFGTQKSQTIIGYQMAFAGIGAAVMPPLFGVVLNNVGMFMLPIMLTFCAALVLFCAQRVQALTKQDLPSF